MDGSAPLTVSQLTDTIKDILERGFPRVTVTGEVSNFRPSARGHLYFSAKDERAVLSCVMFRGNAASLAFDPRDGDKVELRGSISVYPPRGAYQLIVRSMVRAGAGEILAMLEERRKRFHAEGLFERRRPLPAIPRTIAVVPSPTGAAIRDVLHVLRRRNAPVDVRVVPVPVQGAEAAGRIAAAVRYADRHHLGDVIVVTRGGGSIEDLLPFSDEAVVRAIAASATPVVSAVGHEVDRALSDDAADERAPTPSAAAEIVAPASMEIADRIARAGRDIVRLHVDRLASVRRRFDHVGEDELRYRFRNLVQPWYQRHDEAWQAVRDAMERRLQERRGRLSVAAERIGAASPFLALERGYAIVRRRPGEEIVTRADATAPGDTLTVQFADGTIPAERTEDE